MQNEQFKAIIPPDTQGDKSPESLVAPEIKEIPSNEQPIIETDEYVLFMGVEVKKGNGGLRTPDKNELSSDTLTEFDYKMMRDLSVGVSLRQPILIEAGSGIGKSRTVERICAYSNKEMYYANCHDMDVDVLIGKMTVNDNPDAKNQFKWRDGVVIDAIRKGGVLFLDEYNFMKGEARAGLHFVLDAVLNGKTHITLADNHGEIVQVSPDLTIVAAQNPPGDRHTDREVLDPAQYTRFNVLKYPEDLPEETKKARALGELGIDNVLNFDDEDFLIQGGISKEALAEVPGIQEIIEKYLEFAKSVSKMVENGDLASNQPQKPHFAFQRDHSRIRSFVQNFYRGDINDTFKKALTYYFVNKFESVEDRKKIEEALKNVRVEITPDSRRTGLDAIKNKKRGGTPEVDPNKESGETEFSVLKSKLKELGKEFMDESFLTPESYLLTLHPFLLETYKKWSYTEDQLKIVDTITSNPDNIHIGEDIPFEDLKSQNTDETIREKNKSHTGELYLSSESIEYKDAKPFIPEIPEDIKTKGIASVLQYIHDTYKDTHIIPDITYYQHLAQLADQYKAETDETKKESLLTQIPEVLRDTSKYFYFPGSAFVNESGDWLCPCLRWNGGGFYRSASRLDSSWGSNGRVVLLER